MTDKKFELAENRLVLFKNDKAKSAASPNIVGKINIGGTDKRVSLWVKEGKKGKYYTGVVNEFEPKEGQAKEMAMTHSMTHSNTLLANHTKIYFRLATKINSANRIFEDEDIFSMRRLLKLLAREEKALGDACSVLLSKLKEHDEVRKSLWRKVNST